MATIYTHTRKNMTALVPRLTLQQFKQACEIAGITQGQAFVMGLTILFSDPSKWTDVEVKGSRPESANFHQRLNGVLGTYVDTIADTMTTKRLARNDTRKVHNSDVILAVMVTFTKMTHEGRLMSLGRM